MIVEERREYIKDRHQLLWKKAEGVWGFLLAEGQGERHQPQFSLLAVGEGEVTQEFLSGHEAVGVQGALLRHEHLRLVHLRQQRQHDILVLVHIRVVFVAAGGVARVVVVVIPPGEVVVDHTEAQLVATDGTVVGFAQSLPPAKQRAHLVSVEKVSRTETSGVKRVSPELYKDLQMLACRTDGRPH